MATQALQRQPETRPSNGAVERARPRPTFIPRVDILEGEKEFLVVADLPGADESSIKISLEKSELTISGSAQDVPASGHLLSHREYDVGDYERVFTLSESVDKAGIKASVKDGVLRLTLPKAAPAQARRIAIQAG